MVEVSNSRDVNIEKGKKSNTTSKSKKYNKTKKTLLKGIKLKRHTDKTVTMNSEYIEAVLSVK